MILTTGDGSDSQLRIIGLQPFTNYTCSMTANTSIGEGASTDTLTQRTVESGKCVCV